MNRRKTSVWVPVLWFIATGMWTITFFITLSHGFLSEKIVILQGLTALISLAAALVRYKKSKDMLETTQNRVSQQPQMR